MTVASSPVMLQSTVMLDLAGGHRFHHSWSLQHGFDCSALHVPRNLGSSVEEVKIGIILTLFEISRWVSWDRRR